MAVMPLDACLSSERVSALIARAHALAAAATATSLAREAALPCQALASRGYPAPALAVGLEQVDERVSFTVISVLFLISYFMLAMACSSRPELRASAAHYGGFHAYYERVVAPPEQL